VSAALRRLRARGASSVLAGAGVLAAGAMLGTAVTVAYGLATGFDRAVDRADAPDLIASFDARSRADVARRVAALPNVESASYRLAVGDVPIEAGGEVIRSGTVEVVRPGRRGYALLAGHDIAGGPREVVVEQGVARELGLEVGDRLDVGRLGAQRVVGISLAPDNVAYPLAGAARVYLSSRALARRFGGEPQEVNRVLVWTSDPQRLDSTLVQARAVSFGVRDLRFLTRAGVRVLRDEAAGIVIALLVAFSLIATGAAGLMLAALARADVERRLRAIGVLRAVGLSRAGVAGQFALDALLLALPAAALGIALGALVARGPTASLLASVNELPPGGALLAPLGGALAALVAIVGAASAWPAWRAARRAPVTLLRGAELRGAGGRLATALPAGIGWLGLRMLAARPLRTAAAAAVLAVSAAIVLLLLALASLLGSLRDDPSSVGKRYDLTARLAPDRVGEVRALAGVEAASARYSLRAADAFDLGETLSVVAYPGDHTRFEAAPLTEGRRVRGDGEAEIGVGLADALGVPLGATLAIALESGGEARFRVVGIVAALEDRGRIAYVRPPRLLAAEPGAPPEVAVDLDRDADRAGVLAALRELGARSPASVGGAASDQAGFVAVLAGVLRTVALVNALVALYALVQVLTLTALERRSALALLRAVGGGRGELARVFAGAAAVLMAVAVPAGALLSALVLGPAVGSLAADYAPLSPRPSAGQVMLVAAGFALLAALAVAIVARRSERAPVAAGLRGVE
jgi:predicted lysophospholipase L1 biosynthesis ABC-type transport system permease subunit